METVVSGIRPGPVICTWEITRCSKKFSAKCRMNIIAITLLPIGIR